MKIFKHIIFVGILLQCCIFAGCGGDSLDGNILISGETIVFKGEERVKLLHTLKAIKKIYSYDDAGNKKYYEQGVDWIYNNGGVSRTTFSKIPNFYEYLYSSDANGFFQFAENPRNPPLTLAYQIYIDYYSSIPDEFVIPAIINFNPSKVLCIGDSIMLGAHTVGQYYNDNDDHSYCGLIRSYFKSSIVVENKSIPGSVASGALKILPDLIEGKPDLVIIGFGMNDHVGESLDDFKENITAIVSQLKKSGAEIILVGFFQQNKKWALEKETLTISFNSALRQTAEEFGVPFVDVYSSINNNFTNDNFVQFVLGDYMHHPNNYGHRIYFSLLLPYFLNGPVRLSSLVNYVYLRN